VFNLKLPDMNCNVKSKKERFIRNKNAFKSYFKYGIDDSIFFVALK
jgi:hypothetical protein